MRALLALAAMVALTAAQLMNLPEMQNSRDNDTLRNPNSTLMRYIPTPNIGNWYYFLVLKNLFPASRNYSGQDAVTLCTHGHFHYFGNLQPLLQYWEGPVSLAVHAPGADFRRALAAVRWARACMQEQEVAERVSFHVFSEREQLPHPLKNHLTLLNNISSASPFFPRSPAPNCSKPAPWVNVQVAKTFRRKRRLAYPINFARNIAREAASTHWVLVSEIELYPSQGLYSDFLEMVRREPALLQSHPRKVFAIPEFEVTAESPTPRNKSQLVKMIKEGKANLFHEKLCFKCHDFPGKDKWFAANVSDGLHVLHTGKRTGKYASWETTYIGTNADPPYEERMSWEGGLDRLVQGYVLCALDYEFLILDNAFLVHKPGIQRLPIGRQRYRYKYVKNTNNFVDNVILPEMQNLYPNSSNCTVF